VVYGVNKWTNKKLRVCVV